MAEVINWTAIRARLDAANQALDTALDASPQRVEAIMLERTRSLAAGGAGEQRETEPDRALVVRLGGEAHGLWLDRLAGVAPMAACAAAPRSPAAILGLMTVRGDIWTVVDLAGLLGIQATPTTSGASTPGHVVLLRHASRRIALRVEQTDDIKRLSRAGVRALPDDGLSSAAGLIEGLGPDGLILVDIDALWAHPAITEVA
ncbi:MAG: chemotaxis protein CheW [Reyranellaceae bacterium]